MSPGGASPVMKTRMAEQKSPVHGIIIIESRQYGSARAWAQVLEL